MEFDLTCPRCGADVEFDEILDDHYDSPEEFIIYNSGSCPTCGAKIQWKETFWLHAITDIKVKE